MFLCVRVLSTDQCKVVRLVGFSAAPVTIYGYFVQEDGWHSGHDLFPHHPTSQPWVCTNYWQVGQVGSKFNPRSWWPPANTFHNRCSFLTEIRNIWFSSKVKIKSIQWKLGVSRYERGEDETFFIFTLLSLIYVCLNNRPCCCDQSLSLMFEWQPR